MEITKREWDLIQAWAEIAEGYFEHDDEIELAESIFNKATEAGYMEDSG